MKNSFIVILQEGITPEAKERIIKSIMLYRSVVEVVEERPPPQMAVGHLLALFMDVLKEHETKMQETYLKKLSEVLAAAIPMPPTDFMTIVETAQLLGVSLPTLHNWRKEGKLTPVMINKRIRYRREEVLQFRGGA